MLLRDFERIQQTVVRQFLACRRLSQMSDWAGQLCKTLVMRWAMHTKTRIPASCIVVSIDSQLDRKTDG